MRSILINYYRILATIFVLHAFSVNSFAVNELSFSNRAQCAAESDLPADKVFLFIDTYNAQKLAHTYSHTQGLNIEQNVKAAAQEYRIGITHNSLQIMDRLVKGAFPLLPTDIKSEDGRLSRYKKILLSCKSKIQCPELDQYLKTIWEISNISDQKKRVYLYSQVDNFSDRDFIPVKNSSTISCYLVKEFSALQANLNSSKVGKNEIEQIAKAWLDQEKYIASCYSQNSLLDNSQVAVQLEINLDSNIWNKVGFDFWNTTKIVSSWSFRKSNLISNVSRRFHHLFRSIALEESMMFVPNGCKSLTPQKCTEETLSENSIREFAKVKTELNDHLSDIPKGPEKTILEQKPPAVNSDILELSKYNNSADWLENFRKQFTTARGLSKNRIQLSLQTMDRISNHLNTQMILSGFQKLIDQSKVGNIQAKQSLYYTCQEVRLAMDPRFNMYFSDIQLAFSSNRLNRVSSSLSRSPEAQWGYVKELAEKVIPLCDMASKDRLTEVSSDQLSALKFREWAQEAIYQKRLAPNEDAGLVISTTRTTPIVLWNPSAGLIEGNTLCYDEANCLRIIIEAAVRVQAAMKYVTAFDTQGGDILSASMFNPYAELKACAIYDPWMKNKLVYRELAKDIATTALFGWNFIPVYIDASRSVPKVISLNKLIQDGHLVFQPSFEKQKTDITLAVDFGPLAGVPCSVAMSDKEGVEKLSPYYFGGITLNYCDQKGELVNSVNQSGQVHTGSQKNRNSCMGCTLSLVSAESAASFVNGSAVAPIKFGVSILRTISNFISGKSDSNNIPKSFKVNPELAARVLNKFGSIPEMCVDQVNKGLACYQNICAARSARAFEKATGLIVNNAMIQSDSLHDSNSGTNYAYLETNFCDGEIRIPVYCHNEDGDESDFKTDLSRIFSFDRKCNEKLNQLRGRI